MNDMTRYDPERRPDPAGWLALDEAERIDLALQYHRRAGVRLPNARLHATIHVVVENQVALGGEIPVAATLERLQAEGLDRHDALHAVGSVLVKHMWDLTRGDSPSAEPNAAYWAELGELTAERWRQTV